MSMSTFKRLGASDSIARSALARSAPSCLFAALLICGSSLSATPVSGRLILNGTSLVGVSLTTTDFGYSGSGLPSDATFGSFLVGPGSTGTFASYIGDNGAVRSFERPGGGGAPGNDVPLGVPTSYANFIQIPSPSPDIEFILTQLVPGTDSSADCAAPAAAGQSCTPPIPGGSPFELSNVSDGVGGFNTYAQFSVVVEAINLSTGELSIGVGTFTTDFSNTTYQQLLATVLAGGTVTSGEAGDFQVNFGVATPEPPSGAFVAGGLLVFVWAIRRKFIAFRQGH